MFPNKIRPYFFSYRTLLLLFYLKSFQSANGWKYFFGAWDIFRIDSGKLFLNSGTWVEKDVLLHCVTGIIEIGKRTFINRGATIVCREKITIGDDVLIGDYVSIYDHDHSYREKDKPYGKQQYTTAPVVIEDNVWIGSHSVVLKDVKISSGAIVGAGSVVTKNIPPKEIWAGVPAVFIKKI